MSAATSIITFLVLLILVTVLTVVGGVAAWLWWTERQSRERLRETLQQAQIYGEMQGSRLPARSARVAPGQPNVILVQQPEQTRWEVVE